MKTALKTLRDAFEADTATSSKKHTLELEQLIVQKLGKSCSEIITMASADPENINFPALVAKIDKYEEELELYATESGYKHLMTKIFSKDAKNGCHHMEFSASEQTAFGEKYKGIIKSAATDALKVIKKYRDLGMIKKLRYRLLYDQRVEPLPLPVSIDSYQDFLGCLPETNTAWLELEYNKWATGFDIKGIAVPISRVRMTEVIAGCSGLAKDTNSYLNPYVCKVKSK